MKEKQEKEVSGEELDLLDFGKVSKAAEDGKAVPSTAMMPYK